MEIVNNKYPPNIKKIKKHFDLTNTNPLFCYGNKIYNPQGYPINVGLVVHEQTHSIQQRDYKDNSTGFKKLWNKLFVSKINQWWNRYLVDPEFRMLEELEACAYEYKAYCESVKDRNKRSQYIDIIARRLSGPMYGNMMSYSDATIAIRRGTQNII